MKIDMKICLVAFLLVITSVHLSYAQDKVDIMDADGNTVLSDVDEGNIPELVELLDSESNFVLAQVQDLLVAYSSESVPVLLDNLADGKYEGEILRLFSRIKDDRAVEPVSNYLDNEDEDIAAAARNALVYQGDASVARLAELMKDDEFRTAAVMTLRQMSRPSESSMGPVRQLLGSDAPEVRANSAEILGLWKDGQSIEGFKRLMGDEDPVVRYRAVTAYRLTETDYDIDLVLGLLDDSEVNVRREAVAMLGTTSDARVVGPLLDVIENSDDPRMQENAVWSLREVNDPRVVGAAVGLLGSDDPNVVSTSVWVLGDLKATSAVPSIMKIFESGPVENEGIVWSACYALGKMDADTDLSAFIPYLDKGYGSETHNYVLELFRTAGKPGDEKLISAVEKFKAGQPDMSMKREADKTLDSLR